MAELFLKVLNMSLSAGWLVLAVLALRLILRKAPKWIHVMLWGLVAVRLVCPVTLESVFSLIPSKQVVSPSIMMEATPQIHSGMEIINSAVNPILSENFAATPTASANPMQILIPVGGILWLIGTVLMLLSGAFSYFRLKRQVRDAIPLGGNVYSCRSVTSPFILGFLRPRIYLPWDMPLEIRKSVVAHELSHIQRKDHWWKPLGFLLLSLHWFNPLMWLAYVLLCRDIEMACDEKAIREMGTAQSADYSQALLHCSISRRTVTACPLAFGEVNVKQRIVSVLSYKKPGFWIVAVSLILCVVLAVCFLTDPEEEYPTYAGKSLGVWIQDGDSVNKGDARWNFFDITEFENVTLPGGNPVKFSIAEVTNSGLWLRFDTPLLYEGKKVMELYLQPTDRVTLMCNTVGGFTWYGFSIVDDKMITGDGDFLLSMYSPLEGLPSLYSPEQAQKDGCVVMKNGDVIWGKDIWWNFCMATKAGAPSGVRLLHYYDGANHGTPLSTVIDLSYDGENYRLRWFEDVTEYVFEYKYLHHFQGSAESANAAYSSFEHYVLTNDKHATWKGIWNSVISSQSSANVSDFKIVYTNLIYPNEPSYATLALAMRQLESRMGTYEIVSLDVNVITWTLDIGVYEIAEGLEDLVYELLDPQYVRIIQMEGTLKLTEEDTLPLDMVYDFSKYPEHLLLKTLAQWKSKPLEVKPGTSVMDYPMVFDVGSEGYELVLDYDSEGNAINSLRLYITDGWFIDVLHEDVEFILETWDKVDAVPALESWEKAAMESYVAEICSGPLEQSNPGAYIEAHPEAYENLLFFGRKTLYWAFGEFMKSGTINMDLRGHILAQVCRDIMVSLGEEYTYTDLEMMTGGSWFHAFSKRALELKQTTSAATVREAYPGAWLLLNME